MDPQFMQFSLSKFSLSLVPRFVKMCQDDGDDDDDDDTGWSPFHHNVP